MSCVQVRPTLNLETGRLRIDTSVQFDPNGIEQNIISEVYMLKEQCIRDALIRLGWTPPPEAA